RQVERVAHSEFAVARVEQAVASFERLVTLAAPGERARPRDRAHIEWRYEAERLPREGWLPQDPADSLWRAARSALDNGDTRRAAELYHRLRTERRFASSDYRPHAYYWEAYARQRIGGTQELRVAQSALRELQRSHPEFENMVEAERLESRINADLARVGDREAVERQRAQAERATEQCPDHEVRVSALESLLTMPAGDAMPLLTRVMERRDECSAELREKAVFIIAQKKSTQAEDLLLAAVRNDPSPKVREQAVFWLSQVSSEKALEAIEEIIRTSTDAKLVEHAVFAASQHRSPRSVQILRDIATRGNAPIEARRNAIFWLGQRKGSDMPQFMRELYGSVTETGLKEAVLFALSQNPAPENSAFLLEIATNESEMMELRKTALFWAGQQGRLPLE